MKNLKMIKKYLKQNKFWSLYKEKFKHKQMKFAITKIAFIVDKNVSKETLIKMELAALNSNKDKNMYVESFKIFSNKINYKADWKSFGEFMWYIYQTSTYYKDIKKNIKNVYNETNINFINETRRKLYGTWLHSMDKTDDLFNEKIINISKIVF